MSAAPQVCVIDDDESLRVALVGLVRSLGYIGHGFASAEDFLRCGAVQNFACVITDIQMPGMSGIHLKRELLARQYPVPVIMITARSDPGLEEQARASGAACYLQKPFDTSELIACIEEAMNR